MWFTLKSVLVVVVVVVVVTTAASPVDVAVPTQTTSLVMSQSEESVPTTTSEKQNPGAHPGKPEMYSLHVTSLIEYRFASTLVSSRLANPANTSQEIFFSAVLPESAFISKFIMEVGGKVYAAYVKEKQEAKQEYDQAVAAGVGAAHVALSARDSNRFTVSVNIEPQSKVTFNLTYEELLTRRLGAYNHVINLDPGQVVRDLKVDVYIKEARNLTTLRVPELRSGNEVDANEHTKSNPLASVTRTSPSEAHVSFSPTVEQQKSLGRIKSDQQHVGGDVAEQGVELDGLGGQFVVQYDVERDPHAGEVLVNDGFFVHFFAPKDLPQLRKHALFVLDVSGSMEGRKIEQLKEAMDAILDDLHPGDYFNIIEFSYSVTVWNLDSSASSAVFSPYNSYNYDAPTPNAAPTPAFPATPEYVAKAKEIVKKMRAGGGTNIYDTLKTVLRVAHDGLENVTAPDEEPRSPIIVFLTDGEPTVGETRLSKILGVAAELNANPEASIFSLAFGDDADLNFLKTLSLRNAGFARKIYEASDAALQLRDFYRQIASPLLSNVTFNYVPEKVVKEATTKANFHTLFAGSELVVAGKLRARSDDASKFDALVGDVHGLSSTGASVMPLPTPIDIILVGVPTPAPEPSSLERLWAYLTIKQLLEKVDEKEGAVDDAKRNETGVVKTSPKKEALELALKYSFVTPLTSLVVVKPNETLNSSKAVDPVDVNQDNKYSGFGAAGASFAGPVDRISSSGYALPLGQHSPALLLASAGGPYMRPMSTKLQATSSVAESAEEALVPFEEALVPFEEDDELLDLSAHFLISIDQLDWLNDTRNGSDVILPFGTNNETEVLKLYDGLEPDTTAQPQPCSTAAVPQGDCLHLLNCSLNVFQHDVFEYKRYFCRLGGYAAVCCPTDIVATPGNYTPPPGTSSTISASTTPSTTNSEPSTTASESSSSASPVAKTSASPIATFSTTSS